MDRQAREFAGFVVDGVKRMSALLDDLLSFTRLSVSDTQDRVELSLAAEQAIRNLDRAIKESSASITVGRFACDTRQRTPPG